jgi:serine phosphatase RsbU (regulator of sigma subunit)
VLLEDSKETLKKGDMLLLYTDGIIEARFDGKFYGEGSLVDFITNLAPVPAKEVPGLILNDVIQFTDGKLTDDVALLAVSLEK